MVHPRALQWRDVAQWLALPAGSAHVRSISGDPLKHIEWPILAVLSDKQTGLVPAVATVLPNSLYQFCQAHYLRNLAEPLAAADATFKGELRKTVREHGSVLKVEIDC